MNRFVYVFSYTLTPMLNFILSVILFVSIYANWNNYANQTGSSFVSEEVSVLEYNDNFVTLVWKCTDANQALFQIFNTEWTSTEDINDTIQNNIDVCQNSLETALRIWDYNNDSSLKDAVVELLSMEVNYLDTLSKTSNYRDVTNITEEDKSKYDSVIAELNDALNWLNQKFLEMQNIQEEFAEKYWLKLK